MVHRAGPPQILILQVPWYFKRSRSPFSMVLSGQRWYKSNDIIERVIKTWNKHLNLWWALCLLDSLPRLGARASVDTVTSKIGTRIQRVKWYLWPNPATQKHCSSRFKIQDFYWHNWSAGQFHQQTRQHTKHKHKNTQKHIKWQKHMYKYY